jgi:protoporphyrinogen oxidase
MHLGHELRRAAPEQAPAGPATRVEVAIVGAGPSGLSAAWRLERLGEPRFAVFELEEQPGGTSTYGVDGCVPYPWGAHYVPLPSAENRSLVSLLEEIGAVSTTDVDGDGRAIVRGAETVLVREPEERLFIDGVWTEGLYPFRGASEADRRELDRFTREVDGWVAARGADGRRAFAIPLAECSTDAAFTALDRISAAAYLEERGYRSPRLLWYVDYACRDDYGLRLGQTSAWAMLFYFAARVPAPGLPSAPFLTWPEGNGRLVRHLAGVARERLVVGRLVTDVVPREDSVELSVLDARTRKLSRVVADRVILAVPAFVAARLVRPFRDRPPPHLAAFSFGPWMVANLHLRTRPKSPGFPFAWDNVIYDSPALGYVVATHQTLADVGPTVWTYYAPYTDEDPDRARRRLSEADHATFAEAIVRDLSRAHDGLEDAIDRLDVWRFGHAMVRPVPGFVWGEARRRASEPFGRIHFAHSDLSGLALFEEAHHHGVRAAEAVLRARGRDVP